MSQKQPREAYPEVTFSPDVLDEPDTIEVVMGERTVVEAEVENALYDLRNMSSTATTAEADALLDTYKEARDRQTHFEEMWTDFGGQAIDDARAKITSTPPTSTKFVRALDELRAAEDAFYARVNTARDDVFAEAEAEQTQFSGLVTDQTAAEVAAHLENDQRNAPTDAATIEAAHADAITDWETREGNTYDANFGRPTEADALVDAYDEYERVEGTPYDVDKDRVTLAAGAHEQAITEWETREGQEYDPNYGERPSWRNPGARLRHMIRNGREWLRTRDRRTRIGMALGVVAGAAIIGVGIWAARSGNHGAAQQAADALAPHLPKNPNLGDVVDPGTGAGALPDVLTPVNGTLPELGSHAHLYGWASEAFGADHAMAALKEMGERAAADGHNVSWHGSGTHEWVKVDGVSGTKDVFALLSPYAK